MNFSELYNRIRSIEEGTVTECGDMPMAISSLSGGHNEQQDNVTMNVSMNGAGKGGIRDLMDLLKNIEDVQSGGDHDGVDVLLTAPGEEEFGGAEEEHEMGEEYANSPEEVTHDVDAVTATGDDLASKGKEAPKMNGGGNPMQESLAAKLHELYNEVKSR